SGIAGTNYHDIPLARTRRTRLYRWRALEPKGALDHGGGADTGFEIDFRTHGETFIVQWAAAHAARTAAYVLVEALSAPAMRARVRRYGRGLEMPHDWPRRQQMPSRVSPEPSSCPLGQESS